MTIDPLYMMLMIEAIFLLSIVVGLLVFLFFNVKSKNSQGNNGFGRDHLINLLEDNVLEVKEKLEAFTDTGEDNFSQLIEKSVYEMNSDFIIGFRDSLKKEGNSPLDLISEAVTTIYRDTASKNLQWVENLHEKNDLLTAGKDAEEDKAEEDVDLETTQVIEAIDTTEAIQKMKDKHVVYEGYLEDSKKQLEKLQKEKAKAEEFAALLSKNIEQSETFIKDLELGNRDLQTCVDTLQQSNDELSEKIRKLQKVVDAATQDTKRSEEKLEEKEKEIDELKEQLKKAKASGLVVDEEAPGIAEESKNSDEGIVGQDDIDALLNDFDFDGGEAKAEEAVAEDNKDKDEGIVGQDDIDALLNGDRPDSGQEENADLLSQKDVQKMIKETGADTGTLKGNDNSGSISDTKKTGLQATKNRLEATEDEYMAIYNELSPLHEAALAGQEEATTPEAQQTIKDLETKLAEKE
ncbi:MAG: hypothetical protein U9N19_05475, partial [Thermodesulfobacteriota bacterium]|nr:hypothetical protein [Thermodesulfobacteriota bacterium]